MINLEVITERDGIIVTHEWDDKWHRIIAETRPIELTRKTTDTDHYDYVTCLPIHVEYVGKIPHTCIEAYGTHQIQEMTEEAIRQLRLFLQEHIPESGAFFLDTCGESPVAILVKVQNNNLVVESRTSGSSQIGEALQQWNAKLDYLRQQESIQ